MGGKQILIWSAGAILLAGLAACDRSPQAKEARFLKRGAALLTAKNFSRAAIEFHNAAQAMPQDAEPYYQMGLAYLGSGDTRAALGAFKKAAELNPKHGKAQLKLAELLAGSRSKDLIELARTQLQELLSTSPDDPEALNVLAVADYKLGKIEDGTELLVHALEKAPSDLLASMLLSRFKLKEHDPAGAEQVLQKAVASAPRSAPASLALAVLYLHLDKTDLAQSQLLHTLNLDAHYAPAILSLARLQVRQHDLDRAEQTFKQLGMLRDPEYKEYKQQYARFLFARGKRDAALAEFQRLAEENPDDRAARSRLVAANLLMKRESEAKKILADALKRNPNDTDALLQQSEILVRSGDLAGAEKNLNLVLKFSPDSAAAHFALARVRHARGDLPMVEIQELNQALSYNPNFLAARIALCEKFLQTNQFQRALDLMNQAPPAQRNSAVVLAARNWAFLGLGRNSEARAGVDRGLAAGRVRDLVLQDGILKLQARDFQGARADAEEILRRDPEDPRAVGVLVDSYAQLKELGKAAQRLGEMVAQHPQSGKLRAMLGQVLLDSGDEAGGRKQLEAAEAFAPRLSAPRLALARIDLSENRLEAARQRANGLIALDPRNIDALSLAGEIESKAGDRLAAIARYRAVVEIDGSNVRGLNTLAYLLAADKPDDALKFAQKALEIAPHSGEVQDTLGWLYYRSGVYSTATEYLRMAVASEPTPRHQFHLAMSYLKAGERTLGQSMLVTALNKDPDLPRKEQAW